MKLDYRKELQIYFVGEPAQDAGGIAREWFSTIIPHLFKPELGVFKKVDNELYFFNPVDEDQLEEDQRPLKYAKFAGKVIAKALFDDMTIQFPVVESILKDMIDLKTQDALLDVKKIDEQTYKSLKFIKEEV